MYKLKIEETKKEDLQHVMELWNDGEVMNFVGFPNGIGITIDKLNQWLTWINSKGNERKHYSIYHDEIGYCGETFYEIMQDGYITLDIKLFKKARGKNIAYTALKNTIEKAFQNGGKIAYVDPRKDNTKAFVLYERLGFEKVSYPEFYKDDATDVNVYMELKKQNNLTFIVFEELINLMII